MSAVLIIDDDEMDFFVNSQVLTMAGFSKIEYRSSAIAALQYLEEIYSKDEEWPAYIFLDINMRIMNGFNFIEAYLKFPKIDNKMTRIYLVSSSTNFEDVNRGNEYPVVAGYLMKPLSLELVKSVFLLK